MERKPDLAAAGFVPTLLASGSATAAAATAGRPGETIAGG